MMAHFASTIIARFRSPKRLNTFLAAFGVIGALVAGLMIVSGRAAGPGLPGFQDRGAPGSSAGFGSVNKTVSALLPASLCVNPGGTGGCFSTIQAAVNAAANGDTVNVAAGTYDEDVKIPVSLSLLGAGAGTTNIRGPIGGVSGATTVLIQASNVTVAGFTITRLGNNTTDWNNAGLNTVGIAIQGAITNALIRDNIFTGNRTGIDINNSNGHTVRNNVIDFNRTGMIFRNQTDQMTVVENFITNNWTVGILFLDGSGAGTPPQSALQSYFSNNNLSGNWYGQIVDRQSGGALPAPGTTNLKNFGGNWFGTTSPVVTTANSAEPGYAALIPVAYGGSATPPGGQPDIAGPASDNFKYKPFLLSGTDTNIETTPGRGTFGFQGGPMTITPAASPTAADNDYTRINDAIQTGFPFETIKLVGTFDWTEANAAASWAKGSDGVAANSDDYRILVPVNLHNVTFTADNLGDAAIQGPGDLAAFNLERVLSFEGGDNQNWTISKIRFLDFDLSIGMFNGDGGSDAFNNTHITNNYIRIARDLNVVVADADFLQNIGIHYSFGVNQVISGNTIEIQGDGVSNGSNFASDVGMQSNTSGGPIYDGLQITNNIVRVLNAQDATNPQVILGIWENASGHTSNITVSGNQFINQGVGNNPAVNLQRGFRVTSHSSAGTTVLYQNNTVSGANIGFQWLSGTNFSGNMPVVIKSNTITGNGTGVLVQSQGSANLSLNRIVGNSVTGLNNVDGIVTAENNWWGCNAGPGNAGCDTVIGVADFNPWLQLGVSASPNPIPQGGNSTVTADMRINSDAVNTSGSGTLPLTPVTWSATQGTMAPPTGTITSGLASSTFTSNSASSGTGCATVDNQLKCTDITVLTSANVLGTKTKSGGNTPGSVVTYTVVLSNSGGVAQADNPGNEFTDSLPSSLTLVSVSSTSGTAGVAANTATWNGSIAAGGSVTITITATINSGTAPQVVSNQGTINYDSDNNATNDATRLTDDPAVGGASDPTNFTVVSPANVSGTKTKAGGNNPGQTVTYTVVLSNSSSSAQLDNPGNEFTDVLPAGLTLVSASATSGTAAANVGTNTVSWNGSIPGNGSVTITITATINNVPDGTIVSNQGTINYDADGNGTNESVRMTDDPAVGGASDPTSFAVVSKPDLTITKTHSGNFSGGQVGAAYTITVNNIGTGVTSGQVTVTDVVPVGSTPTGPNGVVNGWTCAINAQTLTCSRSDVLAGGASYPPINLTVNVANPAPLNVVNTATVAGGGEINIANNTASDSTAINCSANFALNNTSQLMISRFRENGPAGPQDEFVEIYNPSPLPHTVASGNCNGGGYGVYASAGNGTTSDTGTLVCYIPNGTVIPAGGYYLCTGVTYSLNNLGLNGGAAGATATGDAPIGCGGTCGADIPNDAGLVLTNKAAPTVTTPEGFGAVEFGEVIYDKVGFGPYGPAAPAPGYPSLSSSYCEGGAAGCLKPVGDASNGPPCTNPSGQFPVFPAPPACYGLSGQYEFLRRQTTFSATDGTIHQDTNNNGNDFILISPNPGQHIGLTITGLTGVQAVLGAARPYNRNAPPDMPAVKLTRSPFDGADQLGPRNAERRFIPDPTIADLANNPLGTFTLRFKFTNNSGLPINGIRFEVDNLSTLCGPQTAVPTLASVATGDARNVGATPGCGTGSFTAIFKALNSTSEIMVDGAGTAQFVNGTVMEDLSVGAAPGAGPLSPKGGGIDSTFIINPSSNTASVGDGVTGGVGNFATVLGTTDPTKLIRVRVKFGVVRSGRFILLLVPMAKNSPAP